MSGPSLASCPFWFSSDELCATPRVLVYLLNLCKFFIWQFRNDFRFRNVPLGAVDVIAKVKSRLKCHVPVLFKRFQSSRCPRYFHRRRGARGVVASVNGSHLSIVLVRFPSSLYLFCFFVCVLPLGWLGVIIIVLFFVLRATPWLARGYDYCFVFCLRATPWLVRGYDYCLGFCFTCHPLAG